MDHDFSRTGLIVLGHPPDTKDPRTSMIVYDEEVLERFLDGLAEPGYDPRKDPNIMIQWLTDRSDFLSACERSIGMAKANHWIMLAIERQDGQAYEEREVKGDPHVGGFIPTSSVWTHTSRNHYMAFGLN